MFSINMTQECANWAGNIMAVNFYNFSMHVVIRLINTLFLKCPYRTAYKCPLFIIKFLLVKYSTNLGC